MSCKSQLLKVTTINLIKFFFYIISYVLFDRCEKLSLFTSKNKIRSFFTDKIKDLEHELKKLKTVHKKREKKIIFTNFDMAKPSIGK